MSARPLVLFTDFGSTDFYAGVMRAVLASASPASRVIDLQHDLPAHDVDAASFVLARTFEYLPRDAVVVAGCLAWEWSSLPAFWQLAALWPRLLRQRALIQFPEADHARSNRIHGDSRSERLDAGPARRPIAPARLRDDTRPGRARDGRRAVGGSIVHDHEIVHETRGHRAQDGRDRGFFVERRDDQGDAAV
jgi:hypothetical protein